MGRKVTKDNATQETLPTDEEGSVYDSILSTCCCGGSSADPNSLKDRQKDAGQPQHDDFDEPPKFWDRVTEVALFLIGGAPPVKIVKCFECPSVDGSELTIPRALTNLAEEYERDNSRTMWSISEDAADNEHLAMASLPPPSPLRKHTRSTSSRWDRLRLKGSGSSDRLRLKASSSGRAEDSYLKKRRIKKSDSGSSSVRGSSSVLTSSSVRGSSSVREASSVQVTSSSKRRTRKGWSRSRSGIGRTSSYVSRGSVRSELVEV